MMEELGETVKSLDPDRYLASLFAPEASRRHLWALYAFHGEVARIASLVSEPDLAEIRLQWWLDTLDSIFEGEPQAHPVAKELAGAVKAGDLPKFALANMARAHQFDFYSDPMPSLNDLEGYLGETHGALIRLGAMILNQDAALECAEPAGLGGVAYGLAVTLARLPQSLRLRQCFLPNELMEKRGLTVETWALPDQEAALSVVLAELRGLAEKRLAELRQHVWTIKPLVAPAFLHVALADAYLKKVKIREAALVDQGGGMGQMRKQWLLWKAARTVQF